MPTLVYVFGALMAIGGIGLAGVTIYGMMPKRSPTDSPKLPSKRNYAVEEEEFRNWIETRDAIDPANVKARSAHNDVLLALFGQVPGAAPSAATGKAEAPVAAKSA